MIKEMINELNEAMYEGKIDFEVVKNLLAQLSKLTGLEYGILNKRVTFYSTVDREWHDAYVYA